MAEVAAAGVSSVPPAPQVSPAPTPPTVFKAIGYVEKAGGQLEAIILQENQIQVVHLGDEIAGRYRVTKITPDVVDAIDETVVQIPMVKPGKGNPELVAAIGAGQQLAPPMAPPPPQPGALPVAAKVARTEDASAPEPAANSLGYVEQADGKIQTVVADGESVRLVPQTPTVAMAQVTPPANIQKPATLSQGSTNPVVAQRSAPRTLDVAAAVAPAVKPSGLPEPSIIRQASYQVPAPAAEGSAPSQVATTPSGETAEAVNTKNEPTVAVMPEGSAERIAKPPVEMKPLGFVVKADGEFAAIVSDDDEVYIVREGERFAGHYRAVSVSADVVEVVDEPPRLGLPPPLVTPSTFPDMLSASAARGSSVIANEASLSCNSIGVGGVSANLPQDPFANDLSPPPKLNGDKQLAAIQARVPQQRAARPMRATESSPDSATFIFQTLGYVETEGGEKRAIVADGSQTYLVKQGETFAERYRATSVDSLLVLAVRVSPQQHETDTLSAQADSGDKSASNELYGYSHLPLAGMANAQAFHQGDASGNLVPADLGLNLFSSLSTGFHF
jgi:hypothetical protein